mgnify:CR=1 FL=1
MNRIGTRRSHRRKGFTLIEVLLVLVILVILVSLVVGTYSSAQRQAQVNAAKSQIGLFKTPLEMYRMNLNVYPSNDQGLEALRTPPANLANPTKWQGPYLDQQIPLDPWDNPYYYAAPGRMNPDTYDVWSAGPDGQTGTADDIGNWALQ